MRVRTLLIPLTLGALLAGCAGGPAAPPVTVTMTAQPTPQTSSLATISSPPATTGTTSTATTQAAQPDPHAAEHVPDVGQQMPSGFKLPRTNYQISKIEAITFCKLVWYPGLAARQASRFRMSASETFESGGADGVLIMTTEAAAMQLMSEIRAAATACLQSNPKYAAKSLTMPLAGPWEDSVALAFEQRDAGKVIVEAYGTAVWVARKGRVIVGTTDWTMYAQPVSGEPFDDAPALTRVTAMLKAAKA